jgi:dCMP deaminase
MSKMLKVELYIIPFNDMEVESNENIIKSLLNGRVDDLGLHIGDMEEADIGKWEDDHELNKKTPIQTYRKYFVTPKQNKSLSWDDYFIGLTYYVASKSKDPSTHIGAVIVGKNHEIRSTGFNGLPRGMKESDERNTRPNKYNFYEHGERNAIVNSARIGIPLEGCTMYTNGIPCVDCARAIIQAGITTVVVDKEWNDNNYEKWVESAKISMEMFNEVGVKVIMWEGHVDVPKFRNGKVI